ncbi:alpha/beta hydrolase [Fervidicoccus fontis]|uniref:Alpha/beta hydrolase n=1 Tax=Fervidicoccus fontis TaxID=683846 RepID=A0A7C2VJJ3_9CREN|nr:alpha/beta hydrolase [Fervidicoccus fontis]MBE9391013.1 alpha/beta hydrolase [Fervidicoccus fontis]PMB76398.1 MAG: hypothetical protein C0177_06325 [Fervidicoccus fontis]HEW64343.1 alpha/beta hydrolase [Fervidicoccus fontis]
MKSSKISVGRTQCNYIYDNIDLEDSPIVLLHGYSFSSDVWNEVGIFKIFDEKKIPYIALDMPYGIKNSCEPKDTDMHKNEAFLEEALKKIKKDLKPPLLVGASMGGYLALLYSASNPVSGLLLIGPVGTDDTYVLSSLNKYNFPVCVIIGEKDTIIDFDSVKKFVESLPNGKLKVYESSGHPAYLYKKDRFIEDVLSTYNAIRKKY